jgi:hypothetical protein
VRAVPGALRADRPRARLTRRYAPGMDLIGDPGRGSWLLARAGDGAEVGGVAGTGFGAYARILHPVTAVLEDRTTIDEHGDHPELDEVRWRWADVAARTGTTMRPLVTWSAVSGRDDESDVSFPDGWRVSPPEEGWFDPVVLAALTDHLARATSTPGDLVAGFWDGRSDLSGGSTPGFGWQGDEAPTAEERDGLRGWMAERTASHRRDQDAVAASLSVPRFAGPEAGPRPGCDRPVDAGRPDVARPHPPRAPGSAPAHAADALAGGPRLGHGNGDRLGLDDRRGAAVAGRRRAGR